MLNHLLIWTGYQDCTSPMSLTSSCSTSKCSFTSRGCVAEWLKEELCSPLQCMKATLQVRNIWECEISLSHWQYLHFQETNQNPHCQGPKRQHITMSMLQSRKIQRQEHKVTRSQTSLEGSLCFIPISYQLLKFNFQLFPLGV